MVEWKSYEEWLERAPLSIRKDPLWEFETYRWALFLSDLAWLDSEKLLQDFRSKAYVWQLLDSAGSVPANIEEGYGRGFGKDYARFLRIANGSARECRGWYYRCRHGLEPSVVEHRLSLLDKIIANLTITANQQRNR
ncbi:MAG: four helix bundle protein [Caldilineaceae bacterium]